jgi:hypothetical protein
MDVCDPLSLDITKEAELDYVGGDILGRTGAF